MDKETEYSTPDITSAGQKKNIFIFDTAALNIKNIDIHVLHNEESKSSSTSNEIYRPQISQFLRTDLCYFNIPLRHFDSRKDLLNVNASIVCN
jgi:hypothetical protein